MPRIVLRYPIMRHYAGSIFDLDISFESDDDYETRFFNRQPSKTTYHLPDGGRGIPVELSVSDVFYCPSDLFEGIDLTTGPCRVTSAKTTELENNWGEKQVILSENKQNLNIIDLLNATRLAIFDRKTNQIIQEKTISTPSVFLGFSVFSTGFYEIKIFCKNDILYTITFIKCFPLVVTFDPKTGQFTTMKTIW